MTVKELKGMGSSLIRMAKRIVQIDHDNAGYIETNGKRFFVVSTAITANVTAVPALAVVGSEIRTTHATGRNTIFTSDGTLCQAHLAITPLEPGDHVAALTDNSGGAAADGTIGAVTNSNAGYQYLQNVTAAGTSGAATQLDLNAVAEPSAMSSVVQPDVPRNVVVNFTDGDASIDAFQVDVVGVAPDGSAVTEQFLFAGGLDQVGSKIFATVTSFTLTSINGNGAADTLDVGYGSKLGVPVPAGATSLSIVKLVSNATEEAASATDTTNNSFTPTTAPDGAKDFEVWYEYAHPAITALMAAVKELSTKQNAVIASLEGNAVLASE